MQIVSKDTICMKSQSLFFGKQIGEIFKKKQQTNNTSARVKVYQRETTVVYCSCIYFFPWITVSVAPDRMNNQKIFWLICTKTYFVGTQWIISKFQCVSTV